jgi:hypothetical protein
MTDPRQAEESRRYRLDMDLSSIPRLMREHGLIQPSQGAGNRQAFTTSL